MVLNPFTYTIFQSSSNHQERTDSRRGLNTDETRLKSPRGGGGPGGDGGGVEWTLNCWCFMRAHHYSVEGA